MGVNMNRGRVINSQWPRRAVLLAVDVGPVPIPWADV
jgi:hypothetical protein